MSKSNVKPYEIIKSVNDVPYPLDDYLMLQGKPTTEMIVKLLFMIDGGNIGKNRR